MTKTALAVLLITGIIAAAHLSPAFANDMRQTSIPTDWWRANLNAYLASVEPKTVPWLDHVQARKSKENDLPQFDTLTRLRVQEPSAELMSGIPHMPTGGYASNKPEHAWRQREGIGKN